MIRVVDAEKPIAPPILKAGTDKACTGRKTQATVKQCDLTFCGGLTQMSPMDYKAVDILGSDRQDGAVRAILNPLDAP